MITWLFDHSNKWGFVPNLVQDLSIQPKSDAWWNLSLTAPYADEFRFLKYCKLDGLSQSTQLVSDYINTTASAWYPINLNFWDPDIDYIELMPEYSRTRFLSKDFKILFYYSEGDRAKELLFSLEKMRSRWGFDLDSVRVVIANAKLAKQHPFVYFPDDEVYYRYLHVLEDSYVKEHNLEPRSKKYTCLIRANKIWRKIYASFMYQLNILDQGYFSFTNYQYETTHTGLDDIDQWQDYDDTLETDLLSFELQTPIRCDDLSDHQHNNHKLVDHRFYQDSYFNFVVETHFDNDTIFLTEKTFKPILNLQPFVIIGNPGSLNLLHKLGYKTFGDVIKETYDGETDHRQRMSDLLKMSYDITRLSHKHHIRIQHLIAETLHHNQSLFLSPKINRLKDLLRRLEY